MKCTKRLMKSEKEILKLCEKEYNAKYKEMFETKQDELTQEAGYQTLNVVFYVLAKKYGFGKKRLTELKNSIEDEFKLMETNFLNLNYNTTDCGRFLKEKFNIDFYESQYNTNKEK